MRIWDQIPPRNLCRQHLLGEHRELHAIWSILTENRRGYRNHPEVKRWIGRLDALYARHAILAAEMMRRGYDHRTPLPLSIVEAEVSYPPPWDNQRAALIAKDCDCKVLVEAVPHPFIKNAWTLNDPFAIGERRLIFASETRAITAATARNNERRNI